MKHTAPRPTIGYALPTRDRPGELERTLDLLGTLRDDAGPVVVIDNASNPPARTPRRLANNQPVERIRLGHNEGAAARNRAIEALDTDWIVMLDDDSAPDPDRPLAPRLENHPPDTAAIMADIHLPAAHGYGPRRESGGLPEVFVGCGVAIRRDALLRTGGYDPAFGFYAEEYDLAARLIAAGYRVGFEPRWRVEHRKTAHGRDMDTILARLVRNNGWVMARWAPSDALDAELERVRARYRHIAEKEHARSGYRRGLAELERTLNDQPRTPLTRAHWDRFTGRAAADDAIALALRAEPFDRAAMIARGKNDHIVRAALVSRGIEIVEDDNTCPLVIATLSPGPMLDSLDMLDALDECKDSGRRVIAPWAVGPRAVAPRPCATVTRSAAQAR